MAGSIPPTTPLSKDGNLDLGDQGSSEGLFLLRPSSQTPRFPLFHSLPNPNCLPRQKRIFPPTSFVNLPLDCPGTLFLLVWMAGRSVRPLTRAFPPPTSSPPPGTTSQTPSHSGLDRVRLWEGPGRCWKADPAPAPHASGGSQFPSMWPVQKNDGEGLPQSPPQPHLWVGQRLGRHRVPPCLTGQARVPCTCAHNMHARTHTPHQSTAVCSRQRFPLKERSTFNNYCYCCVNVYPFFSPLLPLNLPCCCLLLNLFVSQEGAPSGLESGLGSGGWERG